MNVFGMEYLTFIIFEHFIAVSNLTGNWFCTPIIFKNPMKTSFSIRNILFLYTVVLVSIKTAYFLFEKRVIGIQKSIYIT